MTPLILASLASMLFVFTFTVINAMRGPSPRAAIFEAWVNIGVGFGVNFVANMTLLPMAGVHLSPSSNWWVGWVYTAVSVVRQYAIRRWFYRRWTR